MVLRDASGVVADSLNYGGLVDPWAAEGDQAVSGAVLSGCYVPAPGSSVRSMVNGGDAGCHQYERGTISRRRRYRQQL